MGRTAAASALAALHPSDFATAVQTQIRMTTDSLAQTEYFDAGSPARIVVFSHNTQPSDYGFDQCGGEKVIYANSGTWRDNAPGYPVNTYIIINAGKGRSGSHSEFVSVCGRRTNCAFTTGDPSRIKFI